MAEILDGGGKRSATPFWPGVKKRCRRCALPAQSKTVAGAAYGLTGTHKISSTLGRAPKYSGRKFFSRAASLSGTSVEVMKKSAAPVSWPGCQKPTCENFRKYHGSGHGSAATTAMRGSGR